VVCRARRAAWWDIITGPAPPHASTGSGDLRRRSKSGESEGTYHIDRDARGALCSRGNSPMVWVLLVGRRLFVRSLNNVRGADGLRT